MQLSPSLPVYRIIKTDPEERIFEVNFNGKKTDSWKGRKRLHGIQRVYDINVGSPESGFFQGTGECFMYSLMYQNFN
jgi:hypothetical protein